MCGRGIDGCYRGGRYTTFHWHFPSRYHFEIDEMSLKDPLVTIALR